MHIFKNGLYSWWQVGILKLSLLSMGIAIGAYWQEIFFPYVTWLAIVGVVLGLYAAYAWIKQ